VIFKYKVFIVSCGCEHSIITNISTTLHNAIRIFETINPHPDCVYSLFSNKIYFQIKVKRRGKTITRLWCYDRHLFPLFYTSNL